MRLVSKIFAAVVFLALTFIVLSPLGAGLGDTGVPVVFVAALVVAGICIIAPTGRRAWGRGFLLDGLLMLAMPLLVLPLLGRAYSETTEAAALTATSELDTAASEIGAGLGAAMVFGAASVIGLILGAIFVILGLVLVLGGRREVIVVHRDA